MKVLNQFRHALRARPRIVALTGATAALVIAAVALIRSAPLLFASAAAVAIALLRYERWTVRRLNRRIRLDEGFGLLPAADLRLSERSGRHGECSW